MIVDEKLDRFATNWGVIPTSIDLAPKMTTKLDAMSIELAGPSFSKEIDFGDGLTGVRLNQGMGFATTAADAAPASSGFDINTIFPSFSTWTWEDYVMAASGLYIGWQILFGPKATARKEGYSRARASYAKQRAKVKEDTALSFF
jgi:hypothetical protein